MSGVEWDSPCVTVYHLSDQNSMHSYVQMRVIALALRRENPSDLGERRSKAFADDSLHACTRLLRSLKRLSGA